MKFKVDENLPGEIADLLMAAGHEALTVVAENLRGIKDPDLADICQREGRCLVTLDLDFADIRTYPPEAYPGMMVMRVIRQDRLHLVNVFRNVLPLVGREELNCHLWIVEETRIRIHGKEV